MSSGGVLGWSAKKIIDIIVNKMLSYALENAADVKNEIKTDISMSLVKSKVQGLRANRNGIGTQLSKFRSS